MQNINDYCISTHHHIFEYCALFVLLPALKLNIKYASRNKPLRRLCSETAFNYNLCGNVRHLLVIKYGSVINFL
jgi:hypothetical protein